MKYSVEIRLRATGLFHAYLDVKGRSEWKTRHIAAGHARDFAKRFPEFICALVDADCIDSYRSTVSGYSYSKAQGLYLYTEASALHIPHESIIKVAEQLGLARIDHSEWLGLALVDIIKAHKAVI